MNTELKTCPFCGGNAEIIQVADPDREGVMLHVVWCEECGCGTVPADTIDVVAELWNRRC